MIYKDISLLRFILLALGTGLAETSAAANSTVTDTSAGSILIPMFVSGVCLSIIALQWNAHKHWQGWWRKLAGAPLVILLIWVVIIIAGKVTDPTSHRLWTIEIFAWSMITPVYTAILITAKKALEKADQELS